MLATAATVLLTAGWVQAGAVDPATLAGEALPSLPGAGLVVFDEPIPGKATRVTLAARVNAAPAALQALLEDPAAYRRAVPAFVRADVLGQRPPLPARPAQRLVGWELEVPLWNLKGKLWLTPRPDGVDLELVEGDFAPGQFRLTTRATGWQTMLLIEARANVRDVNWLTRRLVARNALMEPAMTAAASWVLLQAFALAAENKATTADPRRHPTAAMTTPALATLAERSLTDQITGSFGDRRAVAVVRSRGDGRLERIELGVTVRRPLAVLGKRLVVADTWRALPGWRTIKVVTPRIVTPRAVAPVGSRPAAAAGARWEVDSSLPFVDFDATWDVAPGPPFRARSSGDWDGAILGWDLGPAATPQASTAILSMHPRLDKTGYLPRKFIEAEPLLEHGLAVGLAYVDALSLMRAIEK